MKLRPLKRNPLTRLLSAGYGGAVGLRNLAYDRVPAFSSEAPRPVICVGALHAGGTGKTPMTARVAERLIRGGCTVVLLSRGYGRRGAEPVVITPEQRVDSWRRVGDEPYLLKQRLPRLWMGIGADRVSLARRIGRCCPPATVFVMDDGFQHRRLRRNLDIVCLPPAPEYPEHLLPTGFLREPPAALRRAGVVCVIGSPEEKAAMERRRGMVLKRAPRLRAALLFQRPDCWVHLGTGRRAARPPLHNPSALCGIARPERFAAMISRQGISCRSTRCLRDHDPFEDDGLLLRAARDGDGILTTEKDAVRLEGRAIVNDLEIWYLKVVLEPADEESEAVLSSAIDKVVGMVI